MTDWPDITNGLVELGGAYFTWRNAIQLQRDREIKGVYWPATAFFTGWGLWTLIYYPAIQQWLSFIGGLVLVSGNLVWVIGAVKLQKKDCKNV